MAVRQPTHRLLFFDKRLGTPGPRRMAAFAVPALASATVRDVCNTRSHPTEVSDNRQQGLHATVPAGTKTSLPHWPFRQTASTRTRTPTCVDPHRRNAHGRVRSTSFPEKQLHQKRQSWNAPQQGRACTQLLAGSSASYARALFGSIQWPTECGRCPASKPHATNHHRVRTTRSKVRHRA